MAKDPNRRPPRSGGGPAKRPTDPGVEARKLAVDVLRRIDDDAAYANVLLPSALAASHLTPRDRGFVTELVYGVTRMRRACDWLVDRFLIHPPDSATRAVLRIGAYQLVFLDTPAHAAVAATVSCAPQRTRGLVNAVLRKVATGDRTWPSEAVRLSQPDWLLERLVSDLGPDDASEAFETMNRAPQVHRRADGYVQDLGSQWVTAAVGASVGERVLDLCAAPGGKSTGMAGAGADVVAADVRPGRLGLVVANAARLGLSAVPVTEVDAAAEVEPVDDLFDVLTPDPSAGGDSPDAADGPMSGRVLPVVADGVQPPFAAGAFDRVLVDAPCSGLGALRRRPDARWRITADSVDRLAALQLDLLEAALPLVKAGGTLVYSVCTITAAETTKVAETFAARHPDLVPLDIPEAGVWRPWGPGWLVLPQDADTDGMYLARWQV